MSDDTAAATTTTATDSTTTASTADWTQTIPSEDTRNWITAKQFKDPGALAESYRNLEKLVGAGPDKIIKLPTDDKPEAWNEVYNRLGRPEKADGYKIPVPEGGDANFAKTAAEWFHSAGLTQKQAETVAAKWNEFAGAQAQGQAESMVVKGTEQRQALEKEWGAALEQNLGVAKKAAAAFGFDQATIDALQSAMGYDGVMKFMHNIGSKVGEDSFVSGAGGNNGGVPTPSQATAEIALLRKDPDFANRLTRGDADAKRKWSDLHKYAYPGETVLT